MTYMAHKFVGSPQWYLAGYCLCDYDSILAF